MVLGRASDVSIMNAVISGTTPIVSDIAEIMDLDDIGLQLVVEQPARLFFSKDTDTVVAGTHTWTLANWGLLATDVNGTLKVSGAVQANNNATVTISSRTSATVGVTNGTQTDETFGAGTVRFVVTPPLATGAGVWKVEVSADHVSDGVPALNQVQNTDLAHWSDITAQFSPTILNPDGAAAAKSNQWVSKSNLACRKIRVTFTPSAGAGTARVLITGKASH
jgi:hypothetical protein